MGSWGVNMRQSDYGLDLLGTIVDTQLKTVNFLTFIPPLIRLRRIKLISTTLNHPSLPLPPRAPHRPLALIAG